MYSEPGRGTTIRIYLPRVRQEEDLETNIDAGPANGGTETILVVGDDEEVRATVVEMLSDLGYRVLRAKDAQSALAIVESGVPIDLLFTDVVVPGAPRSTELARKTRERLPAVAVLFTSGYTDNAIVHSGRLDEGIELLSKPYTHEALARSVRHVLADPHRRAASDVLAAGRPQERESDTALAAVRRLSILLVEDDDLVRSSTAELLATFGLAIVEANSDLEAMRVLRERPVDVMLTDVGLGGASGVELAIAARRLIPALDVIFLSARARGRAANAQGLRSA